MQTKGEHSEVQFRVCEGEGDAWVGTREDLDITLFQNGTLLGLYLYDDSFENAQRVVDFLNEHVKSIGVTVFDSHPMYKAFKV